MNCPLPKHPSRRDINIYHLHAGRGVKQTVLAKKHKLTKGRISQIITSVKRWITTAKPTEDMEIPQQVLLATDAWQRKLGYMEELALNQFIEQSAKPEGDKKPAKPDPRLLQRAADLGKATYELAQAHADAQMAVLNFLSKDPRWDEDREVEYTFQLVAEAQERAKLYPDIALPELNRDAVERYIRNAYRYARMKGAKRERLDYLPPEWKQAVGQLFYWPSDEFVAEMKRQEAEEELAKELGYEARDQAMREQSEAREERRVARERARNEAKRAADAAEAKQRAEEERLRREEDERNNPPPKPEPPQPAAAPPVPEFKFPTFKNMDFTRRPEPRRNNNIRGIHPITWE